MSSDADADADAEAVFVERRLPGPRLASETSACAGYAVRADDEPRANMESTADSSWRRLRTSWMESQLGA
jgi:hypothetical protein